MIRPLFIAPASLFFLATDHRQKFGRIFVVPIDDDVEPSDGANEDDTENRPARQPLMLLALNATDAVDWEDLQEKVWALSLRRGSFH